MRVQRVVMPETEFESWTVLGDDQLPVEPVERFLAYLASIEKSPNTIKAYAHDLKDWFTYLVARRCDWRTATLEDVAGFVAWLRLPPKVRDGKVVVLPTVEHHCSVAGVNRKLAALTSFCGFHARHGVELAGLLVTMQPANRRGGAATAYKPFLHHVTKTKPEQRRAITLKTVRSRPKVLTAKQVQTILDACDHVRDRLLFALLLDTGMSPGETLALDRQDIDLRRGVVHVRAGKQKRQREVPLHESTIGALGEYARQRDARFPIPSTPAFFISARGRRMARQELNQTFTKLIREVGLEGRGARARPRPHDLSHAFTVRTLLDWHEAGEDIDRRMPLLSTYLGHVDPASTYWYLEAVPELLELISRRLEQLPEVLS